MSVNDESEPQVRNFFWEKFFILNPFRIPYFLCRNKNKYVKNKESVVQYQEFLPRLLTCINFLLYVCIRFSHSYFAKRENPFSLNPLKTMENYTTKQLTDELFRRGYATQALWCRKDVYDNIDRYNANNNTDYLLDEADVDDILDSCVNSEMIFEQINNDIYEWIASEFYERFKS